MEKNQDLTKKTNKIKLDFKGSKYATGRRKRSIAKVWLKKGSGKIYVNGQSFETYFKRDTHKMQILRPFEIINQPTDYDVRCNVVGGGHTGQAGAMVHGISRALLLFDFFTFSAISFALICLFCFSVFMLSVDFVCFSAPSFTSL